MISLEVSNAEDRVIPRIFLICDGPDTAPIWEYFLRQQGLRVTVDRSAATAIDHWASEIFDLVIIDLGCPATERLRLCQKIRESSLCPILVLLPVHHETEILALYAGGVDDVIIEPVSPPIFRAKILAWMRRGWSMPIEGLILINTGKYILDPARRCVLDPQGEEIKLTSLEFRLMHLLMSRPHHIFKTEDIIRAIWGDFGQGDHVLIKNVVYRLRRKIEPDPSHPILLQTWPEGYSFQG